MMPAGGMSASVSSGVGGGNSTSLGGGTSTYNKTVYMLPEAPGMPNGVPVNLKNWLWPAVAIAAVGLVFVMSGRR